MSGLSVDLLWQRRHRGLVSVGAASLDDAGNALLIKPDEFESRTYQILQFAPNGEATELSVVSVERIRQWIGAPDGHFMIGMTADDIYLFRDRKKTRFMTERRATFADVALAPEPGWFVCGFSDEVFATHGIALGDANGRLSWTRDLAVGIQRVGISGDGKCLAVALADGMVLAIDSHRNTLWEHAVEENLTALAMSDTGAGCVVGTDAGTVRAISGDGIVRWSASIGVPITAVALSGLADFTAVTASEGSTHLLVCLDNDGNPVWEYELDTRPADVCCSVGGRHLLVTSTHGEASCFAVEGGTSSASIIDRAVDAARRLLVEGDPVAAWEAVSPAVAASPQQPDVASVYLDAREKALALVLTEGAAALERGDVSAANDLAATASRIDPWDASAFELRCRSRDARREECARAAESAELLHDLDTALTAWTEVVALDPTDTRARDGLRRVRTGQAESLVQLGEQAEAEERFDEAISAWKEAQRLAPSETLEARLTEAEVRRCLQTGIAHYQAQRLPEAIFQLKKALTFDRANEEARRYLGYATGLSGDTGIADRFARLE